MESEFQIITTEDGSPSVTWTNADGLSESMHNKKGALSESLFIYHHAISLVTNKGWTPRFLSVGLGLGYNELIICGHCLQHRIPLAEVSIRSFESSAFLRQNFLDWLQGKAPNKSQLDWWKLYYDITESISKHFGTSSTEVKKYLAGLLMLGQWELSKELTPQTVFTETYSAILFDAFSSQVSPALWSEEFLSGFIFDAASPNCVFVTYAAKGTLNRALRQHGFIMEEQQGFGGKRQSTFALRVANSLTAKPL
ncbi:MAG: hypothetical protein KDD61_06725 [Bdellovibrionales bacterium]|nr:hypothetical protein [Bdellovibrionales bacterium]